MKVYRVDVVPNVEEQIRAQMLYIAEDSVDNALAWEDRLLAALKGIGRLPTGHAIDEGASEHIGVVVRKMVFERTYVVHYVVDEATETLRVVSFRHGARVPRANEP